MILPILYEDNHLIAINKPHGLAIHKSKLVRNTSDFVVNILADQINHQIFTVHRLDRKTAGVMVFAKSKDSAQHISSQFSAHTVLKTYWAIVRGFTSNKFDIAYDLSDDKGILKSSHTTFENLAQVELDIAFGAHNTSRYSLLKCMPTTGRMHQIRRHAQHMRHPIIGDRPHGCNKQNKLFLDKWQMSSLMLCATEIQLLHPISKLPITFTSNPSLEFKRTLKFLNFNASFYET